MTTTPVEIGKKCLSANERAPTITNNFKPANGKDTNQQIVLYLCERFLFSPDADPDAIINLASRLKRCANIRATIRGKERTGGKREGDFTYARGILPRLTANEGVPLRLSDICFSEIQ